jgi:Domain of unknown function (DUF4340)
MTRPNSPNQARARAALLLCIAALGTTLIAAGSFWVQRSISGEKVIAGKVLPGFAADMPQVRTITIATENGPYNLVRQGATWVMPERGDYPIAAPALSELAKGLSDLTFKAARTSDPAQFARLSVDDPSPESHGVLVTMKGASGQILNSLYVGQKGEALFVRKAGSNDVFEAQGMLPDLKNAARWLDLKVVDVTAETIASVSGQRVGEGHFDIVRRPDGGFAPVGGQANVTATTAAIALTKWAPLDVMAASSLTQDSIASHVTTLRSGVTISVTAYQENGRNWVVLSADSPADDQSGLGEKLNKRSDGWAFELGAVDFADFTFPKSAIINGPAEPAPY